MHSLTALFARALGSVNIKELITNVGSSAGAAPAAGGAAAAAGEEKKEGSLLYIFTSLL